MSKEQALAVSLSAAGGGGDVIQLKPNFCALVVTVPRSVMAAKKMLHYPDNDSTYLEAPELTSFDPDQPPVHTNANNGMVSGKGEDIFLRDDVKIVRTASATQREITFTTRYLHVIPDRGWAETDQPVTMIDGRNIVHAVGMQFDNKAHIVKLLAQVNSEYVPENK